MTPSGWEVKKLNELCEINPKKPSKPSDELVSFISMSQVSEDGQIISTETKTYDEVSKGFTSFKDKDVLVAKITPCFENGKGALAHTLVNGIGFGSTEFHVLRAKENTDPKFIYYLTRTDAFRAKGTMNMQGSAGHRRVTTDFIQIYKINTPPLPEQQKIAKILSTWDRVISTTERLIDNSTQQKKALMQQLLTGKKRLLDESGKPFAGEWESRLFKNILKLDRGSSPRPIVKYMTDSEDGVNWIKIGDTKGEGLYINSTKERITKEGAEKSRKVFKGEVVLSNSMSYGKPYILNIDGYIHDGWFVIRKFEKNIDVNFLIQILSSELIQRQYKRLAAGGVVSNISSELVYAVKINLPSIPEQQKIATVLTNADKEIELLKQQLADLQQEKKALMQVLLTGKKRVVVDG